MRKPRTAVECGNIYFVVDKMPEEDHIIKEHYIWSGRPAVVISNDFANSPQGPLALVCFITRRAQSECEEHYKWLSPDQMELEFPSNAWDCVSTVLLSKAYAVEISSMESLMGHATDEEMREIVNRVKKNIKFDEITENLLYKPADRETGRQST